MVSWSTVKIIFGRVFKFLTRPIRTINIDNRAEKVISREKPVVAPYHAAVSKQKELVDKLYPNFMEEHYKKDSVLDERLKNVFVTSTDSVKLQQKTKDEPTNLLPQKGVSAPDFEFGYYEADIISEGKCSLKQALAFITNHTNNPSEHTIEKIAAQYKMDKNVVASILKHFAIPVVNTNSDAISSTISIKLTSSHK